MKVYSHIGESDKANRHFQSAVTNLAMVSAKHGGKPEPMTREGLEAKLKQADDFQYPELHWKRSK